MEDGRWRLFQLSTSVKRRFNVYMLMTDAVLRVFVKFTYSFTTYITIRILNLVKASFSTDLYIKNMYVLFKIIIRDNIFGLHT